MPKAHNDIRITCNHGINEGAEEFVQLLRYMDGQGEWLPVRNRTVETVTLLGDSVERAADWMTDAPAPGAEQGPRRDRHTFRCDCGRQVQARDRNLREALMELDAAGIRTVSLPGLGYAVQRAARRKR
ncbi:hypothetical protein P3H15_11335 [Rhodococcus sp. T2V]|uniref:hypothetical protein n=1 Tax=Rhodococcus sp. T2V TaxID=3034164 RepID=UPI0023E1D2DC|nr:hypothetical protein [Rhodococcus sp. T2V]MDF3305613.1 hypothetical protein [Rhodococcus sp. T2V]